MDGLRETISDPSIDFGFPVEKGPSLTRGMFARRKCIFATAMAAEERDATTERYREVPAELLYSRPYEAPSLAARLVPYGFGVVVLLAVAIALFFLLSNPVVDAEEEKPEAGEVERLVLNAKERMNRANAAQELRTGDVPVSVFTDPEGASVEIDFENVGVTPVEYSLRPGVYMLSIRKPDYASVDTILILEAGEAAALHFELGQGQSGVSRLTFDDRTSYETNDPPSAVRQSSRDAGIGMPDLDPLQTATSEASPSTSSASTASLSAGTSPPTAVSRSGASSRTASANPSTSNTAASTNAAEFVISSHPSGADAFLDGGRIGTTPISIREIAPGFHEIKLLKDGFEPYEMQVRVGAGETKTLHGELARRIGTLGVLVRPWGSIYIDDLLHERATDVKYVTRLPAGEYTVTAVHPTLGSIEKIVRIEGDAIEEIVIEFP